MSAIPRLLLASFACLTAFAVEAAAPPNDNFADRIVLTGDSITFTGTLAGATAEPPTEVNGYPNYFMFVNQSVWWEWTAAASIPVTLQIIDPPPLPWDSFDGLVVYANPNDGFPTNGGRSLAGISFDSANPWPCFSFQATNNTTYYFQLCSWHSTATYTIALTATNAPIIVEQPKSFAVNTNDSALLTVMATGLRPLNYQWGFNGSFLPGKTNFMLPLDGITTNMAGDYFVVVSNLTGVTTSQLATLSVTVAEAQPALATGGLRTSNQFDFVLQAEAGRYYRVEASPDLKAWSPVQIFPLGLYYPFHSNLTSVIFNSNATSALQVPASTARSFMRAASYVPADIVCNNNLRQIRYAKHMWAWEKSKTSTDSPSDMELFPGVTRWRTNHICPLGGFYNVDQIGNPPSCSITNHVLEEPR